MVINLETAVEFLKEKDNFLILTHSHPDGDTLGSAFALKYALETVGKSANVRCCDTVAKKFDYLGKVCEDECDFDTLVAVDVADTKLLGKDFEERFAGLSFALTTTVQTVCSPKEPCLTQRQRRRAK